MIVNPTPNLWVELIDQIGGRHAKPGFNCGSDSCQEGFNVLLGWLDEQLPVRVAAHVLSKEIKAFLHVRSDGLRGRELDRKSTRLNSSHSQISYAVFCLKKKTTEVRLPRST